MRESKFSISTGDSVQRHSNGMPIGGERYDPGEEARFMRERKVKDVARALHAQLFRHEVQRSLEQRLANLDALTVGELEPVTVQVDEGYLSVGAAINLPAIYRPGGETGDDEFTGVALMTYHSLPDAYNAVHGRIVATRTDGEKWAEPQTWDYISLPSTADYRAGPARKPSLLEIVKLDAALGQADLTVERAA